MVRKVKLNNELMSEGAAAEKLFSSVLKWRFWLGALFGFLIAAAFDLTDFHISGCVGECTDNPDIRIGK